MRDENTVTPLHYKLIDAYKSKQYKNLLSFNNVASKKIHINKVTLPGGIVEEDYDFWGYELETDDEKYLLSCMKEGEEINIKDLLPIYPKDLETVAVKGNAYKLINNPIPARIPSKKVMSFKEMIDFLSDIKTTEPLNKVLMTIFTVMQRMKRTNVIICSNPGNGKDSTAVIMDSLFGGVASISNPSVAKLEYLTHNKLLIINEVSSISKAQWNEIQSFLLDVGDLKLRTQKRTRRTAGVGEEIDLRELSIALYFNDITEYKDMSKFFDNKTDGNVKDRFLPLRLWGTHTENFNLITSVNVNSYINRHYDDYRNVVMTFNYYSQHIDELYNPSIDKEFLGLPERWINSLMIFFQGIKAYSEGDKELYDVLKSRVLKAMRDYKEMLKFPESFNLLVSKLKIPKHITDGNCDLKKVIDYLTVQSNDKDKHEKLRALARAKLNYVTKVYEEPTFEIRNIMCVSYTGSNHNKDIEV